MFDIAWTELLVVAVIAILVVGPKELPGMLRAFGKTFGQVRRTAREFQSTFNDALREAERQASLDDVKKDLDSVRNLDPTKDLRKTLGETKDALAGKVSDGKPTDGKFPKADTAPAATTPQGDTAPEPAKTAAEPAPAPEPAPAAETPAEPGPAAATDDDAKPRAAAGAEQR